MITTMINENIYSKLTPSAKEALDEIAEEYKDSLLEKAFTIAEERNIANKEISLRDILEANQPSQHAVEREKYSEYKRKRLIMLIAFSGAIYAAAGIIIFLFQNKKFSIENDVGLIITFIGVLLSLIAFLYGQF
jgi:histone H3/H4